MYFLLFFVVVVVIYISSFKDDFTKEHMDKVTPAIILLTVFVVVITILSSLV